MIPSPIASSSTPGQPDDRGLMIAKMVPMKRLGEPKEIALVVSMFVKVGYCTGQDITIAGGLPSF
jgi:NAD(P)-dependent dehydrogenase (short-subunit alcohol dehydrogenase family)